MMEMKSGMLVKSKAGHDKGKIYIIIHEDQTYVYLVDGKHKLLNAPKKKRRIHVQAIHRQYEISEADDGRIRAIIHEYEKEITPTFREE